MVLRWRIAAGLVSAGLALALAELLAALLRPGSAPPYVLGAAVVDHTPDGLREWAIQTFGTADKAVLFLVMGAVAVLLAGVAGAVERDRRAFGSALFALFGAVAAVLAADRYGLLAAVPTLLGVGAGIGALRSFARRIDAAAAAGAGARGAETGQHGPGASASRRRPDEQVPDVRHPTGPVDDTRGEAGSQPRRTPAAQPGRSDTGLSGPSRDETHRPDPAPGRLPRRTPAPESQPRAAGTRGESRGTRHERGLAAADRRELLRGLVIAGGAAVAAGAAGRVLAVRRGDVTQERAAVQLPTPGEPPVAIDPAADLRVPGLTPYLTSADDFYRIDTALVLPQVSVRDWSLRIHGLVEREIRIGWDDLARRTAVERLVTLTCVSNPVGGDLVGNALWRGYRLDELLAEAGPLPEADMVLSRSKDGWTAGTPLAVLTDGRDALLAIGMNGEPLPVRHGYPARLVVPGLYGYVSATKWVTELEVTRFDRATAYWTRRGWSALGPIKTGTRIDTPGPRSRPSPGPVPIAGVAWAQHRGIAAVEVQVDGGPWQQARLSAEQSVDTWRQWVYNWDATPGPHTLRARATDGTGAVQTAEVADVLPDGATGYPSVTVRVS
ncbi:sulfite oxidase [Nocardia farcinica]